MRRLLPRLVQGQPVLTRALVCVALAGLAASCGGDDGGSSDPCAGVDCSDHGACRFQDGRASCVCEAGYVADGLSCVPEGGDSDSDTDTDSDTATDTGSDTETDTGSDTDTDTDTDTVTDTDTDTGTGSDTDTGPECIDGGAFYCVDILADCDDRTQLVCYVPGGGIHCYRPEVCEECCGDTCYPRDPDCP